MVFTLRSFATGCLGVVLHYGDPAPGDPVSAQLEAARAHAHHGPSGTGPRHGTALCLSGGGFRAAMFHLGAVRRLDELGLLGSLRTISAVSGGAIVANLLADPGLGWPDPSGPPARVSGFEECVAAPLHRLASRNVRTPAMLSRLHPARWTRADSSVTMLAEQLQSAIPWWAGDLRETTRGGPVILTSATEVGYGVSWLFADARSIAPRGRIGDHRLGYAAPPPGLRVADAVAASCSHPPFFAPLELDGRTLGLVGGVPDPDAPVEVREGIRSRIQLADGGVYDNLGLEPVWSDHAALLVSDGGSTLRGQPAGSTMSRLWHLLSIASGGGKTTRLRWLHAAYSAGSVHGATWSLESPAPGYPSDVVSVINRVRTDLDAFSGAEQMVLERHGYLVTDAAVRRHAPQLPTLATDLQPPHGQVGDPFAVSQMLRESDRITPLGRH